MQHPAQTVQFTFLIPVWQQIFRKIDNPVKLVGFTAFLTQEWIETAFPDDHELTTHAKGEALLDTRIKTVTLESKQLLDQLSETY